MFECWHSLVAFVDAIFILLCMFENSLSLVYIVNILKTYAIVDDDICVAMVYVLFSH